MSAADTIFALSSGAPPCAIAIIRVSGGAAFDAVKRLAGRMPLPRRPGLVTLRGLDGAVLDRALAILFPGPGSATGEDLAELHLHGGRAVVRAVESALASLPDVRKAEPGEFTRRAYLNGRLDLNEAEALSDLLSAETEHQRRVAVNMFGGAFTAQVETWRQDLLHISALTEAELDFSDEDDVADQNRSAIAQRCGELADRISAILSIPSAEKLRDGIRVVLGGPPNSGKSTLLNALVSRDAAIVSEVAGTTRDVIEVPVAIAGVPFVFADTAGIREDCADVIEGIGISRAKNALATADILLWLGNENQGPVHARLIEIDAMADLDGHTRKTSDAIRLSAKTGDGMGALIAEICEVAAVLLPPADAFAVNARQHALMQEAVSMLRAAALSTDWLIVAENLRLARLSLDTLTGRAHTEDLLDTIFGKFCIGK
jgi:tRNA modification GTPase